MSGSAAFSGRHYTLERDNRELQLEIPVAYWLHDYTLERDNRELQLTAKPLWLKPIIPLREIIGNYNTVEQLSPSAYIIPLREIIGNYNLNRR